MKKLTFTVINDLTYDQRMHRICNSLVDDGYEVVLIGRKLSGSLPLRNERYQQKRLNCFFTSGKLLYLEFNLRLVAKLLFTRSDCFCAIDLDTIIPNYIASKLKSKLRVYDAHELFTELKEIVTRPITHQIWMQIERFAVPRFKRGYSVNEFISQYFKLNYKVQYSIVRNLPVSTAITKNGDEKNKYIIYQGAVNEGRSFETLIPAMKFVNAKLLVCGTGNFVNKLKLLIDNEGVSDKVELLGMVLPEKLKMITAKAHLAIMLFEDTGLNQYQSLSNRFFDYIMAGVPQICVNYPQYAAINEKYRIAHLISDTSSHTIAEALNNLLNDSVYYNTIASNCLQARKELNWQKEAVVLLEFYKKLFNHTV